MPCGCAEICNCSVDDTATVSWTGDGSLASPYQATVIPDPTGGLQNTANGVAILIDPASTAPVSTSAAGLLVDCCPISVVDSNCINLTAIDDTTITAELVIDPASPAVVTCGPAGLSVACCAGAGFESTTVSDTDSVELTLTGFDITADVILDPAGGLVTTASGVGIDDTWHDVVQWTSRIEDTQGTAEVVMIALPNVTAGYETDGGVLNSDVRNVAGAVLIRPSDYFTGGGSSEFRYVTTAVNGSNDPGSILTFRLRDVASFSDFNTATGAVVHTTVANGGVALTTANGNYEDASATFVLAASDYYIVTTDLNTAVDAGSVIVCNVRLQARRA